MAKVVYNACYGGFGLSSVAIIALADLGHPTAVEAVERHRAGDENAFWRVGYEIARHDPLLVKVVETLGASAGEAGAELVIYEIKGDRYMIDEYDGYENVVEPDGQEWVIIT